MICIFCKPEREREKDELAKFCEESLERLRNIKEKTASELDWYKTGLPSGFPKNKKLKGKGRLREFEIIMLS